jgi:hypothetical protein
MAEFSTLCPGTTLAKATKACKNFSSNQANFSSNTWVYPNASNDTSNHYRVNLYNGDIQYVNRNRPVGEKDNVGDPITDMFAICE